MTTTDRCRCCPYGFHIDVGFVDFAQDVARGHVTRKTPTMQRKERNLMSPLDSIFSDSMENLVSDFEEILNENPEKNKPRIEVMKSRLQNGYTSDYTAYRSKPGSTPISVTNNSSTKAFVIENGSAPPKPPHRAATTPINPVSNGRSTPSGFSTALGRTISEFRARNSESPLPDRNISSRVGTPVDLAIPNGNGHHNGYQNGLNGSTSHRRDFDQKMPHEVHVDRPSRLSVNNNNNNNGPSWRRSNHHEENGHQSDFASLRRGQEFTVNENEASHRIRYYSASPKLPRKFQAAPPLQQSQFTYSHQNGHTVLSKTQATCTSPQPDSDRPAIIKKPVESRSISTTTGPLPPAKPCNECPSLKLELKETLARVPPPKPMTFAVSTETEFVFKIPSETVEKCVGSNVESTSIAIETEAKEMRDTASSPIIFETVAVDCQTDTSEQVEVGIMVSPSTISFAIQTEEEEVKVKIEEKQMAAKETMTTRVYYRNFPCQTDVVEPEPEPEQEEKSVKIENSSLDLPSSSESASQTEFDADSPEPRILDEAEINESLWLMPSKETTEVAVGPDEDIPPEVEMPKDCTECLKREQVFAKNVAVGNCSVADQVCVTCDKSVEEVDENDNPGFTLANGSDEPKQIGSERVASLKKLLTNDQKQNFVRGTAVTRSARMERKKTDELEYVDQRNKDVVPSTPASLPTEDTSEALKSKVVLKKEIPLPPSNVPEPVPARIPRPKISKYAVPHEDAEDDAEADEAADRLTPLRSELRTLGRWANRSGAHLSYTPAKIDDNDSDLESDDSEGSYDTNEDVELDGTPFEITQPLREALESLNSHLLQPGTVTPDTADWALKYVQHEWLKTTARKNSKIGHVEILLNQIKDLGPILLKTVVNIADPNANTALHYAVSHGNFEIISLLLDSGECQLNLSNKAGYSAVMLAALCNLEDPVEQTVIQRLFEMGDVNARSNQHGQTALMLAVSHGKKSATELLLTCGADVNLQDEEGSTALMCAAEHGHKELVKLLLSQATIDASLTDCDSSTALSIAVENGHKDIGVLIYAHLM